MASYIPGSSSGGALNVVGGAYFGQNVYMDASCILTLTSSSAGTSSTGALRVTGGAYFGNSVYMGSTGTLTVTNTTPGSSGSGALNVTGGAFFGGSVYMGSTGTLTVTNITPGSSGSGALNVVGGAYFGQNVWMNSTLKVVGTSTFAAITKTSGTFDIAHPLLPKKRLVHSFTESPRCDNIYRGKTTLSNGNATVNLDRECTANTNCSMTEGTFVLLCTNPTYYLQNTTSFDRVIGDISGNLLSIVCENKQSNDIINWCVIAERQDAFIKSWDRTDSNGFLITEYDE